jgi:SWI/SNF-related matrix-associated actin-dependent regulator of chromatin subfamily A-like protein 1
MILASLTPLPGNWTAIRTAYDPAIVAQFQEAAGPFFDRAEGAWICPNEVAEPLLERMVKAELIVVDGTVQWAEDTRFELSRYAQRPSLKGKTLYEYQKAGIRFLMECAAAYGGALLGDEMGVAKTAQALRAVERLAITFEPFLHPSPGLTEMLTWGVGFRALVLCPSVVGLHWQEQAEEWIDVKAVRFDGTKTKAKVAAQQVWIAHGGLAICSYDTFRGISTKLPAVDVIVLDELHYMANPKAARTKAVVKFVNGHGKRPVVFGLTGTPITARPRDIWQPLDLITRERFGRFFHFGRRYCSGVQREIKGLPAPVWDFDGASNLDELGERLRKTIMLRRVKADVLELPKLQRITLPVEMPATAKKNLVKATAVLKSDSASVGRMLSAIEEHKIKAAIELAEDLRAQGKKVLLFTLRRETAKQLGEALHAPYVTGEDAVDDRRAKLYGADVGVATVYSVTTGIDLTSYDTCIFVGLDWVPSTLLQAEARVHRLGQDRYVTVYYLIGLGTLDETVRATVIDRLGMFAQVTGNAPDEKALASALSGGYSEQDLLQQILDNVLGGVA